MYNEFIAAKDLPVTEAEEVDVLCVENGELKRKEGASLGGSGGGVLEVDITLGNAEWYTPSSVTFSKTFDEIKEAIEKGYHIQGWVKSSQFTGEVDYHYNSGYIKPAWAKYAPNINGGAIFFIPIELSGVSYHILSDGTTGYICD